MTGTINSAQCARGEFQMRLRLAALASTALVVVTMIAAPALASAALTHNSVQLRAGPGPNFGVVTGLGANSKVGVLWCGPATFDWCLIQFHKQQGWVHVADLIGLDSTDLPSDPAGKGGVAGPVPDQPPMQMAPGAPDPHPPIIHVPKAIKLGV
jgi:hypothetical protein